MTTISPEDDPDPVEELPVPAVDDPVALAPLPADPDPVEPLPDPDTVWPTVRSTEATVPEMVEVSEASLRFVWAVESDDSADVTEASSESI